MFEGRNVHYTSNNKPLCSFSAKLCNLRRLNGYAFCVRHILEDPSAPFKQCAYVVKTSGLRCTSAIRGAEERQYCNAHMQVMGIIPKKERKKKTEPLYLPEGHAINSLDSIKLPNGVIGDENKHNQPNFSASKMFPELAGKLSSSESQKPSDSTNSKSDTLNKSFTKSSPRSMNGSGPVPSRRARRSTRKALSIQRKKQLGLLTDDEAKALLSVNGCKTYNHYVNMRTDNSELLTPLIESSDDESECELQKLLITHKQYLRDTSLASPSGLNSSYYSDLNTSTESLSISEPDEQCSYTNEYLNVKKSCHQLSTSGQINRDIIKYQREFTKSLIETVKDNLSSAVLLVRKIRKVKKKSQDSHDSCPALPQQPGDSVIESRKQCTYQDEDGKTCGASTLPFSTHCLNHISHNTQQKLFGVCSHNVEIDGAREAEICRLPAIDLGQGISLCLQHTPRATDPYDLELDMNLRKKKKKSKPFACRRSKKRRKHTRIQKPVPPGTSNSTIASSSSDSSLALTSGRQSVGDNKPIGSSSPVRSSSLGRAEDEEEGLDSETENMLSPLADSLLRDDSKILDDNEIDEVLNEENFNIFSTVSDDKHAAGAADLELTDADADLIFNGHDVLDNLGKDELPEDITDAILHVEYLEQQEKQEQQNKQQALQHQHSMTQQHILSPPPGGFDINETLDGFNDGDFHQLSQSFDSHQGPPPEYPGATKHLPTNSQQMSHTNVNQQSNNMSNYLHEQQTNSRFQHHQIHPKIPSSPRSGSQSQLHLLRQSSYPMTLPPSSTLLNNSAHLVNGRMGPLPPVSTITMQPDWHSSETPTLYQNGYHTHSDHHMYQHGGLPSPPHYHSTEHRLMYPTSQMFSPSGYGLHHTPRPPQPQRVNMPLQ